MVVQSRTSGRFFKKYGWRRPAAISTGELSRKFSEPAAAYCADADVPSASTVPKQAQNARLSRLNERPPLTRRGTASQPMARLPSRGERLVLRFALWRLRPIRPKGPNVALRVANRKIVRTVIGVAQLAQDLRARCFGARVQRVDSRSRLQGNIHRGGYESGAFRTDAIAVVFDAAEHDQISGQLQLRVRDRAVFVGVDDVLFEAQGGLQPRDAGFGVFVAYRGIDALNRSSQCVVHAVLLRIRDSSWPCTGRTSSVRLRNRQSTA